MAKVVYAEVFLDDHVPETIGDMYRINSITEHFADGSEKNASDFFASDAFHEREDIVEFVALHYQISNTMVDIVN